MTFKFDGNGLKFGRTWVDRIMGKVDKDQGVANAGKYLGVGEDGNVTLKDIVIPEGKTYQLYGTRYVYDKVPSTPTTVTIGSIEYKRYYGALNLGTTRVYTDADIAKVVFNDTDAYCGSMYYQTDSTSGPNPEYKSMSDAGIMYDVTIAGGNIWYTIMVPSDMYETINMTKIYLSIGFLELREA